MHTETILTHGIEYARRRDYRSIAVKIKLSVPNESELIHVRLEQWEFCLFPEDKYSKEFTFEAPLDFMVSLSRILVQGRALTALELSSYSLRDPPRRHFCALDLACDQVEASVNYFERDRDSTREHVRVLLTTPASTDCVPFHWRFWPEVAASVGSRLLDYLDAVQPEKHVKDIPSLECGLLPQQSFRGYVWQCPTDIGVEIQESLAKDMLGGTKSECRVTKLSGGYFLEFGSDEEISGARTLLPPLSRPISQLDSGVASGTVKCRCYARPDLLPDHEGTFEVTCFNQEVLLQEPECDDGDWYQTEDVRLVIGGHYAGDESASKLVEIKLLHMRAAHDIAIMCARCRDLVDRFSAQKLQSIGATSAVTQCYINPMGTSKVALYPSQSTGPEPVNLIRMVAWPNEGESKPFFEGYFMVDDIELFGEELKLVADKATYIEGREDKVVDDSDRYFAHFEPLNPPYTTTGIAVWNDGFLEIEFDSPLGENWKDLSETACEFSKTSRGWRLFFAQSDTGWGWAPNIKQLELDL